ncbi:MAG: ATP-binding protein [Ignavibacteriae bacterium]|nr:ATP-binding protein [Ignavibacteriota bacterium]MCB9216853.1 ATP-binding protein [Ignavibacteria bacterium]
MSYLHRIVDNELDELIDVLPAIVLEGAKGVGKTETALQRAKTVFQLDDPAVQEIARADPRAILARPTPILLDEWQRVPSLWDAVRRAVDEGASPGSFLLTGSASPNHPPTHSGAARVVTIRIRPFTLSERHPHTEPTVSLRKLLEGGQPVIEGITEMTLTHYTEEIVRSGFPGIYHLSGRALRAQLDGYLDRIVDTDFVEMGREVRRPQLLRRWMAAYAAATATSTGYETIRDAATPGEGNKPAKSTTIPYRDVLEQLWIVDSVPAWMPTRNPITRLTRSPKHHLVDPALATRLLGLGTNALLNGSAPESPVPRDGTLLGHLFESLVTLSVRVYAQAAEASLRHLRTAGGAQEVDLIVERDDQKIIALEVKLKRNVNDNDVRNLLWLRERIGTDLIDAIVITTGPQAYRRPDGIAVVPAALLGA